MPFTSKCTSALNKSWSAEIENLITKQRKYTHTKKKETETINERDTSMFQQCVIFISILDHNK